MPFGLALTIRPLIRTTTGATFMTRLPVSAKAGRSNRKSPASRYLTGALLALWVVGYTIPPAEAQAPPSSQNKPNIILILSDDFGYGDSAPYGGGPGRGMPTPSLERLANEGMTAFSFYAQPSCTPGRAA